MGNNWTHTAYRMAVESHDTRLIKRFCKHQYPITDLREFARAFVDEGKIGVASMKHLKDAIDSANLDIGELATLFFDMICLETTLRFDSIFPGHFRRSDVMERLRKEWFSLFQTSWGRVCWIPGFDQLVRNLDESLVTPLEEMADIVLSVRSKFGKVIDPSEMYIRDLSNPKDGLVHYLVFLA